MSRIVVTALVLACGFAGAASAQERKLSDFLPAKVGEKACFTRVYDAKHLAAHPRQRVTSMTFLMRVTGISETGDWVLDPKQKYDRLNYQFAMSVTRRGEKQALSVSGYCPGDTRSVFCARECDGGGVTLDKVSGSEALLVKLDDNGILLGSCEESKSRWLKAGADDKVFRVEKVTIDKCKALEKGEFGE